MIICNVSTTKSGFFCGRLGGVPFIAAGGMLLFGIWYFKTNWYEFLVCYKINQINLEFDGAKDSIKCNYRAMFVFVK